MLNRKQVNTLRQTPTRGEPTLILGSFPLPPSGKGFFCFHSCVILSDPLEVSTIIKSRLWAFRTQIKSDALRGESLLTKEFNQGLGLMCVLENCFRLSDGRISEPRHRWTKTCNYTLPHRGVISCNTLLDWLQHYNCSTQMWKYGWCQCVFLH